MKKFRHWSRLVQMFPSLLSNLSEIWCIIRFWVSDFKFESEDAIRILFEQEQGQFPQKSLPIFGQALLNKSIAIVTHFVPVDQNYF